MHHHRHCLPRFARHMLLLAACVLPPAMAQPQPRQSQPVYRCGSSYSQTPCPGGQAIDDKLSTLHGSTTAAPGQATVYLCKGQGGGQFWSPTHCGQQQALIERMETVPASLPWAQQVRQAQAQWEQARRLERPDVPQPPGYRSDSHRAGEARRRAAAARQEAPSAQQENKQNAAACAALRARIARLDSQGRTGGQNAEMDQLRRQRQEARSESRQQGC